MRERFPLMGSNLHTISLKPLPLIGTGFKSEIDNNGNRLKKRKASRVGADETKISETWLCDNLGSGISYAWNNLRS